MNNSKKTIRIALIGLGTVGVGVYNILTKKHQELLSKTGIDFQIKSVCVKNPAKKRKITVPKSILTGNVDKVLSDPDIDLVIELIGGTGLAHRIVKQSLQQNKAVVTANKALLAEKNDIFKSGNPGKLSFEAAVCGGIPIIKGLREGLISNRIASIYGILNGTSNYILSEMAENGTEFPSALSDAQKLGYAEQDPTMDIDGTDAAHKLAILARIAFHKQIPFKQIVREGIQHIDATDMRYANELGYTIKLIAIARLANETEHELRVQPMLVDKRHPLAKVGGVNNAVLVYGDEVGSSLFYGRGAGERPTASAVVSDIVDQAKMHLTGTITSKDLIKPIHMLPSKLIQSRYYLRFQVLNKPGVLGALTKVLGQNNISLASVTQKETWNNRPVSVVMLTHKASESSIQKALSSIKKMPSVKKAPVLLRIMRNEDKNT